MIGRQPLPYGAPGLAISSAAVSRSQTSVFISHAGEQKKEFVNVLNLALAEEGIYPFVDEHSLEPGTPEAWDNIVETLKTAAVGVPNVLVSDAIVSQHHSKVYLFHTVCIRAQCMLHSAQCAAQSSS